MIRLLDKKQVADRIGVKPKTAATLMMEMNPVVISGKVRKRYRVTEENLELWIAKRMTGKPVRRPNGKKLERR